ncbi:MAG: flagellar export chaperone FlgN [Rhodospirillales bacterium]|nr:flagellar export chaperone FlgN [Rhodospirillales bacterium]
MPAPGDRFQRPAKPAAPPPAKPAAAPPAKPDRVDEIFDVAQHLAKLLERENQALGQRRPAEVAGLQDEKAKLTKLYDSHLQALAKAPDLLAKVRPERREALKALAKKLDGLVAVNGRLLKSSIEANQRVLKAVIETAKRLQNRGAVYSRDGQIGGTAAKGLRTVSVSVNQTL